MKWITVVMVFGAITLSAGCGSSSSGNGASTAAISIGGYAYHPVSATVATGAKITFTNHDSTAHTATSSVTPAAFDSGTIKPGRSATITVAKPGTYTYICQFHPFMHGTIVVR